jgi:hypothetical protein
MPSILGRCRLRNRPAAGAACNRIEGVVHGERGSMRAAVKRSDIPADFPQPNRSSDAIWLEPYPDGRCGGIPTAEPGPEARYDAPQAISLAFLTALQVLPPRQRAALVLRNVLGFHAAEAAEIMESTTESVTSALKRARAPVRGRANCTTTATHRQTSFSGFAGLRSSVPLTCSAVHVWRLDASTWVQPRSSISSKASPASS